MKKLICIFLALLILTGTLAACGNGEPEPVEETTLSAETAEEAAQSAGQTEKKEALILPYYAADSLNPYKAESVMNENIGRLLYDGLFGLDEGYMPRKLLADTCEKEGLYITVTLRDTVFTNGSDLTASDVVYSFNLAADCDYYARLLENFSSAAALDGNRVRFTLKSPDPYAEACLTFPVIKYGQADEPVPSGTGRYAYSSGRLTFNKKHISGEKAKIKTVELYDVKDSSSDSNALQIGNISFLYNDLSSCEARRITAITKSFTLNSLVYIGMNSGRKGLLSDPLLRQVIARAVDREDISENAFRGYALPAETPFNPCWSPLKDNKVKAPAGSPLELTQLLDKKGYGYANDTDTVRSKDGKKLELTLLVNKNNSFKKQTAEHIRTKLKAIGIDVTVKEVSAKSLRSALRKGRFDMYVGEIKLGENMSLSPFFSGGSGSYGISKGFSCIGRYKDFLRGKAELEDFLTAFNEDMPFVPLCYRQGYIALSNELEENILTGSADVFENIYQWSFR